MTLSFLKMHGLGNDFVVLDGRNTGLTLPERAVRAIADRRTGVGCDQLIVLEATARTDAAAFMRIFNGDGSEVAACGNATRCVAAVLMAESGGDQVVIETQVGRLFARRRGDGKITVDMGRARLDWREIPLAESTDTLCLDLRHGPLNEPVAVSMGNPHAVFFVADAEAIPLTELGPAIEHHRWFPQRTNVEVVQVLTPSRLRMRVWERGTGITRACGTGACAALVAAARRGLTGRSAEVVLDGGTLDIDWRLDDHVLMTGPVATTFRGQLTADFLAGAL